MAWAPDPTAQRAAQEAEAEAQAAIARRLDAEADKRMTPFERKLLGVVEDMRDAIANPTPGPWLVTCDPRARAEVLERIRAALPAGSLITGPNGPILKVEPVGPAPRLAPLLDAPPAELGNALDAAEMAVAGIYGDATGPTGYRRLAEAAIEAALAALVEADLDRHFQTSPGQEAAVGDGAAGGGVTPPAEYPAR